MRVALAAALDCRTAWTSPHRGLHIPTVVAAVDAFLALPADTVFGPVQNPRRQGAQAPPPTAPHQNPAPKPALRPRRFLFAHAHFEARWGAATAAWAVLAHLTSLLERGLPASVDADRLLQFLQEVYAGNRGDHIASRERVAQAEVARLLTVVLAALPLVAWIDGAVGLARWAFVLDRLAAWTVLAVPASGAAWTCDRVLLLVRVAQLAHEVHALVEEAKDSAANAGPESGAVRLVRDWNNRRGPIFQAFTAVVLDSGPRTRSACGGGACWAL